jgi:hypothetical protein
MHEGNEGKDARLRARARVCVPDEGGSEMNTLL